MTKREIYCIKLFAHSRHFDRPRAHRVFYLRCAGKYTRHPTPPQYRDFYLLHICRLNTQSLRDFSTQVPKTRAEPYSQVVYATMAEEKRKSNGSQSRSILRCSTERRRKCDIRKLARLSTDILFRCPRPLVMFHSRSSPLPPVDTRHRSSFMLPRQAKREMRTEAAMKTTECPCYKT